VTYSLQKVAMDYPAGSYYQLLYGQYGNYYQSAITPTIWRSTVDSPLTPTRGTSYTASLKFAGEFLGGEVSMLKPTLEFVHYQPILGRGPKSHVLGFHAQGIYIAQLGNSLIPYWEKVFLGGERSIRGYEVYSIGPRDRNGYMIGGTKSLLFNVEYIIPVGGPLYAIFFYDRGNTVLANDSLNWADMYSSAGLEVRLFIPALRVPFRLIFAYNNKKIYPTDSDFAFRFAVGTTF
jgi:outer membrane protein insertion porin family